MSSNSGTGINGIPENLFHTINEFLTNNKTLDFLMNRGKSDIPYGFMAIATAAVGTFTYVTYQDYANEISSGISETLDSIQSTELFIPSAEESNEPLFSTLTDSNNDENLYEDVVITPEETSDTQKEPEEIKPSAPEEPVIEEKEPSAPEEPTKKETEPEKKDEEPGEKYKMGGKSKKRRRTKQNKTKSKRKR